MRAVECPCGEHIEAQNDTKMFEAMKEHTDEEHEGQYSDGDLRMLITTEAYDVVPT